MSGKHDALRRRIAGAVLFAAACAFPAAAFLPSGFEENRGQAPPGAVFARRGGDHSVLLAPDRAAWATRAHRVRLHLVGASRAARPFADGELPGRAAAFTGSDPRRWATGIRRFARAGFRDVWPGIDVAYREAGSGVAYDFLLAPAADPRRIRLRVEGAHRLSLSPAGDLVLGFSGGEIRHSPPAVWEETARGRRPLPARWRLAGRREARIEVAGRDPSFPLVVDPTVTLSTYLGGSALESAWAVAAGEDGTVWVAGETVSLDFPVQGALQPSRGGNYDAFVARLDPAVPAVLWATYLGGNGDDAAYSLSVDAQGRALVAGTTSATNFPVTPGAFQPSSGGRRDGFVARLAADGSALLFSTYLGGAGDEFAVAAGPDAQGRFVVAGNTASADFPVASPIQPGLLGFVDAFVARLAADGSALDFSTWLGGGGIDGAVAVAFDAAGDAVLFGDTSSADFPTVNPIRATPPGGASDLFLARVDPDRPALAFSTYLGGADLDVPWGLALDRAGAAHLVGSTLSADFPLLNPADPTLGGEDGFYLKIDPSAPALLGGSFLGGSGVDRALAVAADGEGNALVAGTTFSADFPASGAFQGWGGAGDAFVARIAAAGGPFLWASFLGGSGGDGALAAAVDGLGNGWVAGDTASPDFPLALALQAGLLGPGDAFLARIGDGACVRPGAVGNSLEMVRAGADLFARWQNAPLASDYTVWSDLAPDFALRTAFATGTDGPTGVRAPAPAGPLVFFAVRAVNSCGEGR